MKSLSTAISCARYMLVSPLAASITSFSDILAWLAPSGCRLLKPGMKNPRPGLAEGELELVLRVRRRFCRFILIGEDVEDAAGAGEAEALEMMRFFILIPFVLNESNLVALQIARAYNFARVSPLHISII